MLICHAAAIDFIIAAMLLLPLFFIFAAFVSLIPIDHDATLIFFRHVFARPPPDHKRAAHQHCFHFRHAFTFVFAAPAPPCRPPRRHTPNRPASTSG